MDSVVPTYGLVSFNTTMDSKEMQALRTKLRETSELFKSFSASIADMYRDLDSYNATVLADLNTLNEELFRLQRKMHEEAIRNRQTLYGAAPESEQPFDYGAYQYTSAEMFMSEESVREDPDIVALFRKIASKTHPDKTSDVRLHALFIRAKEFRKQGDLNGLKWILQQVDSPEAAKEYEYEQALAALKCAVADIEASLAALRNSADYELWTLYVSSPMRVKYLSNDQLRACCDSLRRQLDMLRKAAGESEPEPEQNPFGVFFIRG